MGDCKVEEGESYFIFQLWAAVAAETAVSVGLRPPLVLTQQPDSESGSELLTLET